MDMSCIEYGDLVEILTGSLRCKQAFVQPWSPDIPEGHVRVRGVEWVVTQDYLQELRIDI